MGRGCETNANQFRASLRDGEKEVINSFNNVFMKRVMLSTVTVQAREQTSIELGARARRTACLPMEQGAPLGSQDGNGGAAEY